MDDYAEWCLDFTEWKYDFTEWKLDLSNTECNYNVIYMQMALHIHLHFYDDFVNGYEKNNTGKIIIIVSISKLLCFKLGWLGSGVGMATLHLVIVS